MAAKINEVNQRFVHVSYQAGKTTYFKDSDLPANYYVLTGATSSEATLTSATLPNSGEFDVIPPDSVAYVSFADGTTAIVTHLEIYGKATATPPAYTGNRVKVVDIDFEDGGVCEFPGTGIAGSDNQYVTEATSPYAEGDIIIMRVVASSVGTEFKVGLVTSVIGSANQWCYNVETIYDSTLCDWHRATTSYAS